MAIASSGGTVPSYTIPPKNAPPANPADSGPQNLQDSDFSREKSAPVAAVHAADRDGNSNGPKPSRALPAFSDRLKPPVERLVSACQKVFLTGWWTWKQVPTPRSTSPDFAEILRIPAAKSAMQRFFQRKNQRLRPPYMPPAAIGMRVAPSPLVLSLHFATIHNHPLNGWFDQARSVFLTR